MPSESEMESRLDLALHNGDALKILQSLPDSSVDIVLTDPPYASGGSSTAARMANVLGPEQLRGVQIVYDSSSLLGRQVVFEHNALPQLVLPFVLDAGHIALSETQRLDPDRHDYRGKFV